MLPIACTMPGLLLISWPANKSASTAACTRLKLLMSLPAERIVTGDSVHPTVVVDVVGHIQAHTCLGLDSLELLVRLPGCPLVPVPACTVTLTDPLVDTTGPITVRLRKSTSAIWLAAVVDPRLTIWLPGEVVTWLFSRTMRAIAFGSEP